MEKDLFMFKYLILFALGFGPSLSYAKKIGELDYIYSNKKILDLQLYIPRAVIKVIGKDKDQSRIHIKGAKSDEFKWEENDGRIVVRWLEGESKEMDKLYEVQISGGSFPLSINAKRANISMENWKEQSQIHSRGGTIEVTQSEGPLKIFSHTGTLKVLKHKGNVEVDNYAATVELSSIEGNLNLSSFSEEVKLTAISGESQIKNQKGDLDIKAGNGDLFLVNQSGQVKIEGQKGKLRLNSNQGKMEVKVAEKSSVRIRSQEGDIKLFMGKNSGAHMNIGTNEGELYHPRYLEVKNFPQLKVAKGRLRGNKSASVFVRTNKSKVQVLLK